MQKLYEYAFKTEMDKGNFRKKIKQLPLVKHDEKQQYVKHRPAKLFSFDQLTFKNLLEETDYVFKM
jgi:hypothetical protein